VIEGPSVASSTEIPDPLPEGLPPASGDTSTEPVSDKSLFAKASYTEKQMAADTMMMPLMLVMRTRRKRTTLPTHLLARSLSEVGALYNVECNMMKRAAGRRTIAHSAMSSYVTRQNLQSKLRQYEAASSSDLSSAGTPFRSSETLFSRTVNSICFSEACE